MVDLLLAPHLGRLVRVVCAHGECECEAAADVHALVGLDLESEVEDVVGIGEFGLHRCA